jgi:hypothetical protein
MLLRRAVAGTFEARNAWLICLTHGPLVLTVAAYLFSNARITGGFLLPAFYSTPIVLLVVARADITGVVVRKLALCVAAVWLPMLIASPLFGYYAFTRAGESAMDPGREIAIEATSLWRSAFGRPLRYVSGEEPLATAATFYSPDSPSYIILDRPAYSPWATIEQVKREGLLIVCPATAEACIEKAAKFAVDESIRSTRELSLHFFGRAGKPERFVFIMRPPEN